MTTWTLNNVEDALRALDADRFANHVVLDRLPWLWKDRIDYVDWKTDLAVNLGVDPYSLLVVGSAATGVTLNPKKQLFSTFGPTSDVDVAVVSYYHFESAWKTLRELGSRGEIPTRAERRGRRQHREYLVFDGTIATDWFLEHLSFGIQWRDALRAAGGLLPENNHEVKARIYRDVDALRTYQVRNIRKLRDALLTAGHDDEFEAEEGLPLPTVDEDTPEEE